MQPFGLTSTDAIELLLAVVLAAMAFVWQPWLGPLAGRLAANKRLCIVVIAALPLILRLALLAAHPVPIPANYDEFSHLLVADTLLHGRLANPAHPMARFFETFFVLQEPTYSSIYPLGLGFSLAVGKLLFGLPWAGVLLTTGTFCGACYWMLRGWTTPEWALAGGVLAVSIYGPLSPWMNTYWGGSWTATAGCLVFGALPRLREIPSVRNGAVLGLGLAMHVLSRPFESVFLFLAVLFWLGARHYRLMVIAVLVMLPALGITLLQNKRVTGEWLTSPYVLSQRQYGVPAALSFQANPVPQRALTPGQELDYRMQASFRPGGRETVPTWFTRLLTRIRSYRFYFTPALYIALAAFLLSFWRDPGHRFLVGVCLLFALGTNFFPAFRYHYVAGIVCLFILLSLEGLRRLPPPAARWLLGIALVHFTFWYGAHTAEGAVTAWDTWNGINHGGSPRAEVATELDAIPGDLLVFVRYWPGHIFQDEWVWNEADIDHARVIFARDLGDGDNRTLLRHYQGRTVLLLEPDARPARLSAWIPEEPVPAPPRSTPRVPQIPFEPVR